MGVEKTKVLLPKQIKEAAELLARGEVVAFPTETVYGLGPMLLTPKRWAASLQPRAGRRITP